jgi:hypothetical protein
MAPRGFFDAVAAVNAELAVRNPDDLRHAINAIMALDAFFGILHASLHGAAGVPGNDSVWKEQLASSCESYKLLRDAAYTLKHGQLTGDGCVLGCSARKRSALHGDQVFGENEPMGSQA